MKRVGMRIVFQVEREVTKSPVEEGQTAHGIRGCISGWSMRPRAVILQPRGPSPGVGGNTAGCLAVLMHQAFIHHAFIHSSCDKHQGPPWARKKLFVTVGKQVPRMCYLDPGEGALWAPRLRCRALKGTQAASSCDDLSGNQNRSRREGSWGRAVSEWPQPLTSNSVGQTSFTLG